MTGPANRAAALLLATLAFGPGCQRCPAVSPVSAPIEPSTAEPAVPEPMDAVRPAAPEPVAAGTVGPSGPVSVGEPAPALAGERVYGTGPVDLAAMRGQVVVLNVCMSWCMEPCLRAIRRLAALRATREARGVRVLIVSDEPPAEAARLAHDAPAGTTIAVVRDGLDRLGVRAVPFFVVVDRDGIVRFAEPATAPALEHHVDAALDAPASPPGDLP